MKPLRPYVYHAYYNWILDNDNTPYLLVNAEYAGVDVPKEYIREDGKIILNVFPDSVDNYEVTDEYIQFSTRFNRIEQQIFIPFGALEAIYSREKGEGTMFQAEEYYSEANYLAREQENLAKNSNKPTARKARSKEQSSTKRPASGKLKLVK